jgi:hypothetical protein
MTTSRAAVAPPATQHTTHKPRFESLEEYAEVVEQGWKHSLLEVEHVPEHFGGWGATTSRLVLQNGEANLDAHVTVRTRVSDETDFEGEWQVLATVDATFSVHGEPPGGRTVTLIAEDDINAAYTTQVRNYLVGLTEQDKNGGSPEFFQEAAFHLLLEDLGIHPDNTGARTHLGLTSNDFGDASSRGSRTPLPTRAEVDLALAMHHGPRDS